MPVFVTQEVPEPEPEHIEIPFEVDGHKYTIKYEEGEELLAQKVLLGMANNPKCNVTHGVAYAVMCFITDYALKDRDIGYHGDAASCQDLGPGGFHGGGDGGGMDGTDGMDVPELDDDDDGPGTNFKYPRRWGW